MVPSEARRSQSPWTRFTGSYEPSDMNVENKTRPLQKQYMYSSNLNEECPHTLRHLNA